MSGLWATILAAIVVAVVRTWIKSASRTNALRQLASRTPEMAQAAQTYAERERDRQRVFHRVELSFYKILPGRKVGTVERTASTPVVQAEQKSRDMENPAA